MRLLALVGQTIVFCGLSIFCGLLIAQTNSDDPITVSAEHPRLLLRPARLRLLKRERERSSARWRQFQTRVEAGPGLPEPGFALALYYQVTGDTKAGQQAIAWALKPGADLRQQALVFDWCQDLMTPAQSTDLSGRLQKGLTESASDDNVSSIRSRVFAAVVLYDHVPKGPPQELERVVRGWWKGKMLPGLKAGKSMLPRDDAYAFWELLHAVRDNTMLDLREDYPRFFKDFPIEHLLSYYPLPYEGPDSDYYIGTMHKSSSPDLRVAALSRAAEMAMVALDPNAAESQVLQGWLMHERYALRGPLGAPYEFLWANPYQPGLSYYHVPLIYYNPDFGRLFVRSSWEDSAKWLGYFDGTMQISENGSMGVVDPKGSAAPIAVDEAWICPAQTARKFKLKVEEAPNVFLVGLQPRKTYQIEIDDEEMYEASTDPGGIIHLELPKGKETGVRIRQR
jgi:hypothetical protein